MTTLKKTTCRPGTLNILLACTFSLCLCTFKARSQDLEKRTVHLGLVYPISSNGSQASKYNNGFSLHGILGVSGAERNAAISGFANLIKQNANGLLLTGFLNAYGEGNGAQIAGFVNKAIEVRGMQLAGFMNLAGNVQGFQLAGALNIAKDVKGVQFAGLLNIADNSDYPIGVINLIKNGEKTIGLSIDEHLTSLVSFRSGGRVMYGILGVGYNLHGKDTKYAAEGGLGAHLINKNAFRLDLETAYITVSDLDGENYFKSALRILPSYRIGNSTLLFAGPTFNYLQSESEAGKSLIKYTVWDKESGNKKEAISLGVTAGIQFVL